MVITKNGNATYTVTGLTLGKVYNVSVTAPGYTTVTSTAGVWSNGEVGKYVLTPVITTYFQVTDQSTGQGITNATITLTGGDLTSPKVITTNSNATYTVTGLTLGKTYNVSITAPGYQNLTSTAGVWNPGEVGKYTMTPTVIYLQVTSSATGQGITNATITLTGGDLTSPKVITTNSNATYTITGLTLGKTYNVSITAPSYVTVTSTAGIWSQGEVAKYAMTQVATPIYSTDSACLANGSVEPHWKINGGPAYVYAPFGSANSDNDIFYYISPSQTGLVSGMNTFSTTFNIPTNVNLSTAKLGVYTQGEVSSLGEKLGLVNLGNGPESISLNGVSSPVTYCSFGQCGETTIVSGFAHGTNTITVSSLGNMHIGFNDLSYPSDLPIVNTCGTTPLPQPPTYPVTCEVPYYPAGVTGTPWAWYIDVIPSQGAAPIQGQQQTTNPGLPLCSSY